MSTQVAIVQDSLEFARQINSDLGRVSLRALQELSEQLRWKTPIILRDEEVSSFIASGALAGVSALVIPSNAARHRDSSVLAALCDHAQEVSDCIDSGMGLLVLHQYTHNPIGLPLLDGLNYRDKPTDSLARVKWHSDYTSLFPHPLALRLGPGTTAAESTMSPVAWKTLDLPADGSWRPLATRTDDGEVLGARLNRTGNAVIVSTLPADWLDLGHTIENWLLAAAMGRPSAVTLASVARPDVTPPLVTWDLTKEERSSLVDPESVNAEDVLLGARPLDIVFASGALGPRAPEGLARLGFRSIEIDRLQPVNVIKVIVTESDRLAQLGEQLFRAMVEEHDLIDELLSDPRKNLFPLRNIIGATALLQSHSLELATQLDLVIRTADLMRASRKLAFEGMTMSSVVCATQILALIARLDGSGDCRMAIKASAGELLRLLPAGGGYPLTRDATTYALRELAWGAQGGQRNLDLGLTEQVFTRDDLLRARELIHVFNWALRIPIESRVDLPELPSSDVPRLTDGPGGMEYVGTRIRALLPSNHGTSEATSTHAAQEFVASLESSAHGATTLAALASSSFGLAWAYEHEITGPWLSERSASQNRIGSASSTRDLARIRSLESERHGFRRLVVLGRASAITMAFLIAVGGAAISVTLARQDLLPPWAAISIGVVGAFLSLELAGWFSVLPSSFGRLRGWLRETVLERGRSAG